MEISNKFILMINDERYFESKWTTEFKQLDHTLYEFIGVITHAESRENTKLKELSHGILSYFEHRQNYC